MSRTGPRRLWVEPRSRRPVVSSGARAREGGASTLWASLYSPSKKSSLQKLFGFCIFEPHPPRARSARCGSKSMAFARTGKTGNPQNRGFPKYGGSILPNSNIFRPESELLISRASRTRRSPRALSAPFSCSDSRGVCRKCIWSGRARGNANTRRSRVCFYPL